MCSSYRLANKARASGLSSRLLRLLTGQMPSVIARPASNHSRQIAWIVWTGQVPFESDYLSFLSGQRATLLTRLSLCPGLWNCFLYLCSAQLFRPWRSSLVARDGLSVSAHPKNQFGNGREWVKNLFSECKKRASLVQGYWGSSSNQCMAMKTCLLTLSRHF